MKDVKEEAQSLVDQMAKPDAVLRSWKPVAVRKRKFRLAPNAYITGIDISERTTRKKQCLAEKILGDIQTTRWNHLLSTSSSAGMCWNISGIRRMRWGTLPRNSRWRHCCVRRASCRFPQGVITKFTPHWFHVAVYRYWLGNKNAGKPGYAPFPTFLKELHVTPGTTRISLIRVIWLSKPWSSMRAPCRLTRG
jgi:hypothetical protein